MGRNHDFSNTEKPVFFFFIFPQVLMLITLDLWLLLPEIRRAAQLSSNVVGPEISLFWRVLDVVWWSYRFRRSISRRSGSRWPYSSVTYELECPAHRLTSHIDTPDMRQWDTNVWRSVWRPTSSSPALVIIVLKFRDAVSSWMIRPSYGKQIPFDLPLKKDQSFLWSGRTLSFLDFVWYPSLFLTNSNFFL